MGLDRHGAEESSSNCLTMPGEDTGLGALASPLAGYLGKVQERGASLEHCPWCTSKGLSHVLRSYRINLHDSFKLCTNPQCLFPLVSRPLEDIFASLEPTVSSKRKNDAVPEEEESTKHFKKRLRLCEATSPELTCVSDSPLSPAESQHNGYHSNDQALGTTGSCSPFVQPCIPHQDSNSPPCVVAPASRVCSEDVGPSSDVVLVDSEMDEGAVPSPQSCSELSISESDSKQRETPEAVDSSRNPCSEKENEKSYLKDVKKKEEEKHSLPESGSEKLSVCEAEDSVVVPKQLFWNNTANLCWLNSLLIVLVNCKSLREREPQQTAVGKIMKEYKDICAVVRDHQHTSTDGVIRVPNHMLQKANEDLESLRTHVFKLLKPKLKCKMGQRGSPVFAMPVLLALDSWAKCLFQSDFTWEFKCTKCDYAKVERVTKPLPSVTNLVPDWHPLNAVHSTTCNKCHSRKQQRTMKLESLSSVFALHFVKGLPDNNVDVYTFDFKKESYSVTTVIQYKQQLRHFVTWTRNADGSWLEYDDLKHPVCKTHQKLFVPPLEMHVVFWESSPIPEPRVCSPSSTFTETLSRIQSPPSETKTPAEVLLTRSPDQSLLIAPHDSDIIHALSEPGDVMDTTVTADASIGTTTLLDTFEGLTHSDIITLTLVECKAEMLNDSNKQNTNEVADSTPDSSSAALENKQYPNHDDELPSVLISSASESNDDSASDPTFVPSAKKGSAECRHKTRSKTQREAAAAAMAATVGSAKVKEDVTRVETKPVSTTGHAPPLSSSLPDLNGRWSYLLSKHQTPSVTQVKSNAPPLFSTPKPPKNPYTPAQSFTKKLKTEDSESFPLRAAEMYGAFGARTSSTPKQVQPIITNKPTNVTVTSLKGGSELSSVRKSVLQSAQPPLALNTTDALRYKLLKKLKAKKKKLAKLNMRLGNGEVSLHPDSTDLCSPSTVSSSTYDGSVCSDFLSDLLSPATTASHISPDSTEYMEMIANTQDGAANHLASTQTYTHVNNEPSAEDFLEEFLSQAEAQRPTDMETEALYALELFL